MSSGIFFFGGISISDYPKGYFCHAPRSRDFDATANTGSDAKMREWMRLVFSLKSIVARDLRNF